MKALIDFDGLFDKKLARFMEENKEKYTEKQWEDIIPNLYKKFGDTYVAKVKCTPKEYYARMSETELVETLTAHLKADVPIPEFLCAEIESRGENQAMISLLYGDNAQAAAYALNILGDDSEMLSLSQLEEEESAAFFDDEEEETEEQYDDEPDDFEILPIDESDFEDREEEEEDEEDDEL